MKLDQTTYKLTNSGSFGKIALVIGVLGLVISGAGYAMNADQFFYSYLTAFVFWTEVVLLICMISPGYGVGIEWIHSNDVVNSIYLQLNRGSTDNPLPIQQYCFSMAVLVVDGFHHRVPSVTRE